MQLGHALLKACHGIVASVGEGDNLETAVNVVLVVLELLVLEAELALVRIGVFAGIAGILLSLLKLPGD